MAALELDHGQQMFGFVRRQGLSDTVAQDAVQETLLRHLLPGLVVRPRSQGREWSRHSALN